MILKFSVLKCIPYLCKVLHSEVFCHSHGYFFLFKTKYKMYHFNHLIPEYFINDAIRMSLKVMNWTLSSHQLMITFAPYFICICSLSIVL